MDIQRKETIVLILDPDRETPGEANAATDRLQDIQVTAYAKFDWAPSAPCGKWRFFGGWSSTRIPSNKQGGSWMD